MDELILLENPRGWYGQSRKHAKAARRGWRGKGRNPVGFDEFGNPIYVGSYRNRLSRRGNPMARTRALALPKTVREWTQGVDVMDAGAAFGGLAASTMIPGMIVKETATTGQKIWKIVVSLGSALGAGGIAGAMISSSAGRAAIIGGLAGACAQAVGMFTTFKIGQPAFRPRRIGGVYHEPPMSEETRIITNVT